MKRRNFLTDVALTSFLLACNKRDVLLKQSSVQSATKKLTINTDYLHFNSYGQSLALGGGGMFYDGPFNVVSTVQKYDSVMPNLGARSVDYAGETATDFAPLVETVSPKGGQGETMCSGTCEMFCQMMGTKTFQLHAAASGKGAQSVLELSKGSPYYQRLMKDIQTAKNIAGEKGKTFSVGAIGFTHGEKDYRDNTSQDDYRLQLEQLNTDVNSDVAPITQQSSKIPFIVGQASSQNRDADSKIDPTVALAQLDLCINHPNFTLGTPMYMFDYLSDNTHLYQEDYRIVASYYGYAMKKLLIDGVKNFIYPKRHQLDGNTIRIRFNVPAEPLVFDTERVFDPGHFGFVVRDALGNEIAINKVELHGNTVKINCASVPSTVSYAIDGEYKKAGRQNGPRGCLRDSQGDTIIFDPGVTNWKSHNWTPIFKLDL